jgi:hypothetical protein
MSLALRYRAESDVATLAVVVGGRNAGLVGISLGMTFGSLVVWLTTSFVAYAPLIGLSRLGRHCLRLFAGLFWFAIVTWLAVSLPLSVIPASAEMVTRSLVFILGSGPWVWAWMVREGFLPRLMRSLSPVAWW